MRRLLLMACVVLLAGCGGSGARPTTTSAVSPAGPLAAMAALVRTDPALSGTLRMLFEGSGWSVVQSTSAQAAHAVVFQLEHGHWVQASPRGVTIGILGPSPGAVAPARAQVAIEVTSRAPFVETALWVDGGELQAQGGGSPTSGTIYGAVAKPLAPGVHVAVGYARSAQQGRTIAWRFRVA